MKVSRTPPETMPVRAVPDALRRLWHTCRTPEPDDCLSRALCMNLVAVAAADAADRLRATVDGLLRRLPCRAFLVLTNGCSEVSATVSGATRSQGRSREIVLEQIELCAGGGHAGRLAGIVRPLLVNDIPTHLYWADTLPDADGILAHLRELCDHAIVDSGSFRDPEAGLAALAAEGEGGRPFTDLAWLRLRPWRRGLARAFEHFPWRPDVPTAVAIRHALDPAAHASAILLGRWLERRLAARVELAAGDAAPGATPETLDLRHGEVHVRLAAVGGQIRVEVTLARSCLLPFAIPGSRGGHADLLAAAIDLA